MITDTDLKVVFLIYYDNNPSGFNAAFQSAGYNVPTDPETAKVFAVKQMYDLYISNPAKLQSIMSMVPWDYANPNYTNLNNLRDNVQQYLYSNLNGLPNPSTSKIGDWIQNTLFGNHQTVVTQTQTTPINTGTGSAAIIGYSVLGAAVVVMVIFSLR